MVEHARSVHLAPSTAVPLLGRAATTHRPPLAPRHVPLAPRRGRPVLVRPATTTVHGYLLVEGPVAAGAPWAVEHADAGVGAPGRAELVRAGVSVVHVDELGAAAEHGERPGLATLLGSVRRGDTVVVASLDRLAPTVARVVRTVSTLGASGVTLRALREGLDTATTEGRAVVAAFGALADFDRRLAYPPPADLGPRTGRPRSLTVEQVSWARQARDSGAGVAGLASRLGVGQSTLYRALAG